MKITKPSKYIFNLVVLGTVALASCSSGKKFTYLSDELHKEQFQNLLPAPKSHILKSNDNLYISILSNDLEMNKLYNPATTTPTQPSFNDPAYKFISGYEVDSAGNINLPSIGKIMVAGRTINQAQDLVESAAKKFLKEVTVKIRLLNYKVTVIGEVKNPGVYYNYDYNFNVIDAISMASGVTDVASLDKVMILRLTSQGNKTYTLNLKSKTVLFSEAFYLEPNDILIVQPDKTKNYQQKIPLIAAVLSAISSALIYTLFRNTIF